MQNILKISDGNAITMPITANVYGRGSKLISGDLYDGLYIEHIEKKEKGFLSLDHIANYKIIEQ